MRMSHPHLGRSKIAVNCNQDRGFAWAGLLGLVEKVNNNQTSDFRLMAGMDVL
jgi:hypothetical protein